MGKKKEKINEIFCGSHGVRGGGITTVFWGKLVFSLLPQLFLTHFQNIWRNVHRKFLVLFVYVPNVLKRFWY